jgi:hypothetical protein
MTKSPRKSLERPSRAADTPSKAASRRYVIGYGNPPRASQFKRGVSGNPRGRPKGRKNLRTRLADVLSSKIVKRDGDKRQTITVMEGMLWKQVENGLRGSERAFLSAFRICAALGLLERPSAMNDDSVLSRTEEELVSELLAQLAPRSKKG